MAFDNERKRRLRQQNAFAGDVDNSPEPITMPVLVNAETSAVPAGPRLIRDYSLMNPSFMDSGITARPQHFDPRNLNQSQIQKDISHAGRPASMVRDATVVPTVRDDGITQKSRQAGASDFVREMKMYREAWAKEMIIREHELAQRRLELEEREKERKERTKEREERMMGLAQRKLEVEEREKERQERAREKMGLSRISRPPSTSTSDEVPIDPKPIEALERRNAELSEEVAELRSQLETMKTTMDEEKKKTSTVFEYINLFQFPPERVADANRLRSLITCVQQKLAELSGIKAGKWWSELGPSLDTSERVNKAVTLLQGIKPDGPTQALLSCRPAMEYVVETKSRIGGHKSQSYVEFGAFSKEVYESAWERHSREQGKTGEPVVDVVAFQALVSFACTS